MAEKFILRVNSHSLTQFQECRMKFAFNNLMQIRSTEEKHVFLRGKEIGRILNLLHYRIRKYNPQTIEERHKVLAPVVNPIHLMRRFGKNFSYDETNIFIRAIGKYLKSYNWDDWRPIGIETGFSKVIHEDDENLFIYEGRPDMIVLQTKENLLTIGDNKTQSQKYHIYPHNNQVYGYLWGIGARYFFYNYLHLIKDPEVRREAFTFNDGQIEAWKTDTIKWMFKMKEAIQEDDFPLCRYSCQDKYGLCEYVKICEFPKPEMKQWIIRSEFKKVPRHESWTWEGYQESK